MLLKKHNDWINVSICLRKTGESKWKHEMGDDMREN